MESENKKEIQALKREIQDLKTAFSRFLLHTHNGFDSNRIDLNNTIGKYNMYKQQRPTQ